VQNEGGASLDGFAIASVTDNLLKPRALTLEPGRFYGASKRDASKRLSRLKQLPASDGAFAGNATQNPGKKGFVRQGFVRHDQSEQGSTKDELSLN
jgi:hypothetical protein